jgi:hypothetical protein
MGEESMGSRRAHERRAGLLTCAAFRLLAATLVAVLLVPAVLAQSAKTIGKAVSASGTVTVLRGKDAVAVKSGDEVLEHDIFETGADGKLAITFTDKTAFALGPSTRVAIDTYFFDPASLKGKMLADIKKGTMMVRTGELTKQQPGSVRIKTPRTVLGVRGTTFVVSVEEVAPEEQKPQQATGAAP